MANPSNGGPNQPPPHRLDYGVRNRRFEWRSQWWANGRDASDAVLDRIRGRALRVKRAKIERQRTTANHLAAYAAPPAAGSPWVSVGPRNVNGRVKCLAVHPADPQTVYAGAASGGVWKSTDGGQSWYSLWHDEESLSIGALAIAPTDPDVVYAATGEWAPTHNWTFPGAGIFASTDGGNTWTQHTGLVSRRVSQARVSPTDPNTVYVAGESGFEVSTDGGATWNTLMNGQISDMAIDPINADVIYINVCDDGIYKTENAGANWDLLANGPTGASADWVRLDIGVSGAHGSNFVVAKRSGTIYTTTNGGADWVTLPGSHGDVSYHRWCNLVAVAPDDESILLAGGATQFQRTEDGGADWDNIGAVHADHHRAVFAPSDTSIVYTCNDGGVYRSENKGALFRKASHGMVITQFYDVGSWEAIGTVVAGGSQDQGLIFSHGGLTWMDLSGGDGGYFVIHPDDPRTMYAELDSTDIRKSANGGQTWVERTAGIVGVSPWIGVITMDPNDPDTLFTGTQWVFRTTDGCATPWEQVSQELIGDVTSIAVARSNSDRVYAATSSGMIVRSDDGGDSSPWDNVTEAPLPDRPCTDVVVDDSDEDRVVAVFGETTGGAASHVFLSTNGGGSWTDISGDLPDIPVNAAALDPNDSDTMYVGTDAGVYRTTDGGTVWEAFDNGIPNVVITDLTIDPEDELLVAATYGRGMYKVSIAPANVEPAVDLYLRDSVLDTGERFPTPSNLPNPTDLSDTVRHWESPDIKVEVQPFYSPDSVFDGVEFDEDVEHDDPYRDQVNRVYLQVHNRGYENATDVRVRVFFTSASGGLPEFPNALVPPDFDLISDEDWQPVGPAQTIPLLEPNRPVVVHWDFEVPADATTHSCLIGVVSSNEDPITTNETDPEALHKNEKRVCLKNLHVIDSPGPRPPAQLVTINFHNILDVDEFIDIVVSPAGFAEGVIGMIAPPLVFRDPPNALHGVKVVPLLENEFVGDWYVKPGDKPAQVPTDLWAQLDRTRIYDFDPAKASELRGVRLPAKGKLRAVLSVRGSRRVPYGVHQRFAVMQRQHGRIIGGSTFEVRLRRARALHPVSRIRVTLEKIRMLDDNHHWFKGAGEFQFDACIEFNNDPCRRHFRRLPHQGSYRIKDRKGHTEQIVDMCIFDGFVAEQDRMTITLLPAEKLLIGKDQLALYRRKFDSPPENWVGRYVPGDEARPDPEALAEWLVWYRIESVPFERFRNR